MKISRIEPPDLVEAIEVRASTRENALSREMLRQMGITEESTAELLRTTHRGWACKIDGKMTGFAIGNGKTGELWVLAMLPEFEGRGIGSELLLLVENWLWSLGWTELWLTTSPDVKLRAFSFYTKRGWTIWKVEDDLLYLKKNKA